MSQNKLYVGNLPFTCTEAEIESAFATHGTVQTVKVITDRETGRPRGFAFVEMGSDSEAQRAIQGLDGQDFGGRALRVSVARARESSGGGPDGHRGGRRERW